MTAEDKELERIKQKMVKDLMNAMPDANGEVNVLTGAQIDKFVNNNKLAIIDFFATWCPPCKIMEPITKQIAEEFQGKVAFAKINTDKERDAAMKFNIRYVPTFYFFKDGEIVTQFSGAKKKKDFVETMEKAFEDKD
jgi:thioredoxin 1